MAAVRWLGIALLTAMAAWCQDAALSKLQQEAERLRVDTADLPFGPGAPRRTAAFQNALRDWIEQQLPASEAGLQVATLQSSLQARLRTAGLAVTDSTRMTYGYIGKLELSVPKDDPELLTVIAGVSVPCGVDEAIYVYRFSGGSRVRVLEDRPDSDFGSTSASLFVSAPAVSGRRLLATTRFNVRCSAASVRLDYSVFGLSGNSLERLGGGAQEAWPDDPEYEVALKPDEFILQLRGRSLDAAVNHRTLIFRYRVDGRLSRIEPVALSARDFVEEWLENSWSDAASSSAAANRKKLEEMHRIAQAGFLPGNFELDQNCSPNRAEWQIAISSPTMVTKKNSKEPAQMYFVVRETGKFRYELVNAAMVRQPACPGSDQGSAGSPWLSVPELLALQ